MVRVVLSIFYGSPYGVLSRPCMPLNSSLSSVSWLFDCFQLYIAKENEESLTKAIVVR